MSYPYQNPQLPVEERVEDLLSRMSLEEKFVQMRLFRPKDEQIKAVPLMFQFWRKMPTVLV